VSIEYIYANPTKDPFDAAAQERMTDLYEGYWCLRYTSGQ